MGANLPSATLTKKLLHKKKLKCTITKKTYTFCPLVLFLIEGDKITSAPSLARRAVKNLKPGWSSLSFQLLEVTPCPVASDCLRSVGGGATTTQNQLLPIGNHSLLSSLHPSSPAVWGGPSSPRSHLLVVDTGLPHSLSSFSIVAVCGGADLRWNGSPARR